MNTLLRSEVEKAFHNEIKQYSLVVKDINDNEVALVASTYAIGVCTDRDGVTFLYYDISQKKMKALNLGLYLLNKRRNLLRFSDSDKSDRPFPEYLRHNLEVFENHLAIAGTDILRGEKDWMGQYSWPTANVSVDVLKVI